MNSTSTSSNCDASLGPTASHCGAASRFDFTVAFEHSALSITPYVIFLSAAIPRLFYLWKHNRKIIGITFVALQLTVLVSWSLYHGPVSSRLGIVSSALGLATALVMAALSYLEHERTVRPSTILCVYLLLSILFDAAQCRTLWLLHAQQPAQQRALLPALFTAQLANKALKRCPEAVASVFSRCSFWWLNDLLTRGFSATLDLDTLYETDEALRSSKLVSEFQGRIVETKPSKYRLLLVIAACLKVTLIKTVIARVFVTGFKFAKPFLLQYIITFVQNDQKGGEYHKEIAFALIAATGLLFIGTAVATGFYNHHLYRSLVMIRGGLISLVCTESLGVSTTVASEMATLTLIGPDVEVVCNACSGVHDLWANPVEIGLATWLLARQLGVGCVGPVASALLCFILMSQLPKRMGPAIKAWNVAIQKRVSVTSRVVGSIRETKMLGLVPVCLDYIQSLRVFELKESRQFRMLIVYMNLLGNLSPSLAPILTFGITLAAKRHAANSGLDISTVFTSLSIMGLLMSPLANLLSSFPSFVSSLGIFERFEDLLKQTKFHDTIVNHNRGRGTAPSKSTHSVIELSRTPENCITLRKACLSAEIGGEALLHDIDLTIKPGELCVVSGKVGSGKSLLLQALLGELPVVDGNVHIDVARFGYCSQSAWLFKGTVRDNIVGWTTADFDETWYNTVIKACDLVKDLAQLSDGDMTVLSTKGDSLSGGQRHRVALARALYAAPHVFVIDDIFASLDPTTRSYVWEQVFGPSGLARALGSAVIIATHSGEFPPFQARISPADVLQVHIMERADHVVIMEQCRILRQGPYTAAAIQKYPVQGNDTGSSGEQPKQTPAAANSTNDAAVSKEKDIKQQIDDLVQSQGDTSLYWYYFKSVGWKYGLIGLSLATSVEVFLVMGQNWLKWWTESNFSDNKTSDAMYYGVYCIFGLAQLVSLGSDVWFMFIVIIPKSARKLHWKLLRTTLQAPMSFFASKSIGSLVNRFSQDMTLVDQDLPIAVFTSLKGSLSVIGSGALVMLGSAYLAATIPVALALLYALQKFYLRTSRQLRLLQLRASAPLFSYLVESAEGLATVRAFCWEIPLQHQAVSLVDLSQRPYYLLYAIQRWLAFVLDMMVGGLAVILVALAVVVRQSGPGSVAVSLFNVLGFSTVLAQLVTSWTQLETSLGAIARLRTFEQTTPRELEKPGTKEPPFDWPSWGAIEIRNLWASYRSSNLAPATAFDPSTSVSLDAPIGENDLPVLRQLIVSIRPGEKVAICGRTGSGKSSLVLTLYQLLRYSGITIIDGVDISLVPLDTLRTRLISVPQEPYLFPATIRFNLRPGACSSPADDEKLLDALAQVSLRDTVLAVPGGLDANVADVCLSQGQKQLFSLARALVIKNNRGSSGGILVLDEATSAMDTATERLMMDVVEGAFANYTVLAVAHRLESPASAANQLQSTIDPCALAVSQVPELHLDLATLLQLPNRISGAAPIIQAFHSFKSGIVTQNLLIMADSDDYLQDGFNPRSVTIPRLRSILVTHNIDYPSTAKKTQLVALVEEHVLPQVPKLRAQRARAKRSSLGIVNAGSAQDNGLWDDDELSPPRPTSRRSKSPRKSSARIKVEEEEPATPSFRDEPRRNLRASRSASRQLSHGPEDDAHLYAAPASSRRSSRRTVTPQIKPEPVPEPEPEFEPELEVEEQEEESEEDEEENIETEGFEEESTQYEEEPSVFTDDNPFQGGSSPPPVQTPNRRRTVSVEPVKSAKSARRRTALGTESTRTSRRFEMATPPSRYKTPDHLLEPGEEFTPDEQLELEDEAASGDVAAIHRQAVVKRRPRRNIKTPFFVLLMALFGAYLAWFRQEKMAVGYCGLGRPAKQIIPPEIPVPDIIMPFIEPECETCPQHAFCYEDFTVRCQDDFILKPHPLALGGLIPLPPTCEPDSEKARRVQAVADKAIEELRDRRAKYECGELTNDAGEQQDSPTIAEEELKATVSQKRNKRMNSQEFDELWEAAIGEITGRDEVEVQTTTPESPNSPSVPIRKLSSTSLARLPFRCAVKRSIRSGLARYRLPIGLLSMLVLGVLYLRASYRKHLATSAQIPALVDTVLGRLANQKELGDEDLDEPYLFLPNLRDDVLRSVHSLAERDRIWQRVRAVVEQNSNVRTSQREGRSGEVGRAWEWIGPSQGEGARRRRSGRVSWAPSDMGEETPESKPDVQVKKEVKEWDEPRPIY
ncbi:hypothetical protein MY4038_000005 [Beauveria bassiana]